MTNAELERRVAELEAELALLRAHRCPQPVYWWPAPEPPCTCGTSAVCQKHPVYQHRTWISTIRTLPNICGAAGNGFGNVVVNTAGCAERPVIALPNPAANACAAGFAGQVYTVTVR